MADYNDLIEKLAKARSWREAGLAIGEVADALKILSERVAELEATNRKLRQSRKGNKE